MSLIDDAIAKMVPRSPIFEIKANKYDKTAVEFCNTSDPHMDGGMKTPIEILVDDNYQEHWVDNKYVVMADRITDSCKYDIRSCFTEFLRTNMKQKYPMETKMGLFYCNIFYKPVPAFEAALISTYNFYMDKKDVPNTMKLLEYLFIKHENDFPKEPKRQKKKRRRRR